MTNTSKDNKSLEQVLQRLCDHSAEDNEDRQHHASLRRASVLVLLSNDEDMMNNEKSIPTTGIAGTEPRILLTQRTSKLRSHGGEVCFPGGKQEESDLVTNTNPTPLRQDPDLATALRETREEVGLDLGLIRTACTRPQVDPTNSSEDDHTDKGDGSEAPTKIPMEVLCRLATLESKHHLCVTPIVGYTPHHSWQDFVLSKSTTTRIHLNPDEVDAAFWVPLSYFQHMPPVEEYTSQSFVDGKSLMKKYKYDWQEAEQEDSNQQQPSPVLQSENNSQPLDNEPKKNSNSFLITGLTAHIAREVSRIAFPSATKNATTATSPRMSGHLERRNEGNSSRRRYYWTRRYFVLENNHLHQYESREVAARKAAAANKKNRLHLDESTTVTVLRQEEEKYDNDRTKTIANGRGRHDFAVSVLEGRIVWYLAAETEHERQEWIRAIVQQQQQQQQQGGNDKSTAIKG